MADFICEDFAKSFKVSAETHAVLLYALVAHLCDEFIENGVLLSKVDDFHLLAYWFLKHKYIFICQ